jgi:WD40 repeat protein
LYDIAGVSSNPDGSLVAIGFLNGVLRVCDTLAEGRLRVVFMQRMSDDNSPIVGVKFYPHGGVLAVLQENRKLYFIKTSDLTLMGVTKSPKGVTCMEWVQIEKSYKLFIGTRLGFVAIFSAPSPDSTYSSINLKPKVYQPHVTDIGTGK